MELAQLGALKTLLREALVSARVIHAAAADARAALDAVTALRAAIDAVPQAAAEAAAASAVAAALQMSSSGKAGCARECYERSGVPGLQLSAAAVQPGLHNSIGANERRQSEGFMDVPIEQPATSFDELATADARPLASGVEAAAAVLLDSVMEPVRGELERLRAIIADLRTDLYSARSFSPRRLSFKAPQSAPRFLEKACTRVASLHAAAATATVAWIWTGGFWAKGVWTSSRG